MKLPRLVALSPGDLTPGPSARRPFLAALEAALEAGLPGLLLREPRLEERHYLELVHDVRTCFEHRRRPWFALHDRPALALALEADALHLSFRSLTAHELAPFLAGRIAVGVSTHAGDEAARWAGADYRFHGPVRATPSKAGVRDPIGFAGLARAVRESTLPVLGIGGLRPGDVAPLRASGAHGLAVLRGILGAAAPGDATRAYLEALDP